MQMTEGEIRQAYKAAKYKKKQISILAERNGCSTGEILGIVHSDGARRERLEMYDPPKWQPTGAQKALIDRLDELDTMIKPLEDEYRRTAEKLVKMGGCGT